MKPSPWPNPKSMGSERSIPMCFNRLPVAVVSQCCPSNGLKFETIIARLFVGFYCIDDFVHEFQFGSDQDYGMLEKDLDVFWMYGTALLEEYVVDSLPLGQQE